MGYRVYFSVNRIKILNREKKESSETFPLFPAFARCDETACRSTPDRDGRDNSRTRREKLAPPPDGGENGKPPEYLTLVVTVSAA